MAYLWEGGLRGNADALRTAAKLRGEQMGPKLRAIALKGSRRLKNKNIADTGNGGWTVHENPDDSKALPCPHCHKIAGAEFLGYTSKACRFAAVAQARVAPRKNPGDDRSFFGGGVTKNWTEVESFKDHDDALRYAKVMSRRVKISPKDIVVFRDSFTTHRSHVYIHNSALIMKCPHCGRKHTPHCGRGEVAGD